MTNYFQIYLTIIASGMTLWILQRNPRRDARTFVDPKSVKNLANQFDSNNFVNNAWNWVGKNIRYSDYASMMNYNGKSVQCKKCLLPRETIRAGYGNCVAKASLLASLLRNKLPASKVYMVLGNMTDKDGTGGHAWVEVRNNGKWEILEATKPPSKAKGIYKAEVYLNDQEVDCRNGEFCLSVPVKKKYFARRW